MKRQRGRNRNHKNNNIHNNNRQMDSNGPDVKVRGSATQIYDKYVTLARDATVSGNRVKAENYLQHAEHYLRVVNMQEAARQASREEADAVKSEHESKTPATVDGQNSSQPSQEEKEGKRERRYPPRGRRAQDSVNQTNFEDKSLAYENKPVAAEMPQKEDETAQDKPKTRRRAPARSQDTDEPNSEEPNSEEISAAE